MPIQPDKLSLSGVRLSIRFQNVVFPVDLRTLIGVLQGVGYQPLAQLPPVGLAMLGTVGASGPIAARGTTVVDLNSEREFIGVQDPVVETAVGGFSELVSLLSRTDLFGTELKPWFVELQAQFSLFAGTATKSRISKTLSNRRFAPAWSKVLGAPVADYQVRVSPRDVSVDSPDFFDVIIEPSLQQTPNGFKIVIIFRHTNSDRVVKFAQALEKNVRQLLLALS